MYCTNVRNYVIKIHVFDYLISAETLCLDYPADSVQSGFMNVISGKQLLRLAIIQPCYLKLSHAIFWGQA